MLTGREVQPGGREAGAAGAAGRRASAIYRQWGLRIIKIR